MGRGAQRLRDCCTLDAGQALSGLVFMPEMLRFCGKRFRVFKVAHKTCDTIKSYTIRRMIHTVHLNELRCDGAAHAGCQAGCLLFWKEAWLKRVPHDTVKRPKISRHPVTMRTGLPYSTSWPVTLRPERLLGTVM